MSTGPASITGFSVPSLPMDSRAFASSLGVSTKRPLDAAQAKDPFDQTSSPLDKLKRDNQKAFASLLSESVAARTGSKRPSEMTIAEKDAQARQAAEDFVAVAFVQPIFKNLRSSHMGAELPPPLGPGPGEKQFRSLADTQVAKQLVHASRWPLVDSLTARLRNKEASNPRSPEAYRNAPALPGSPADLKRREAARAAAAATTEPTQPRPFTGEPTAPKRTPITSIERPAPSRPHFTKLNP